MGFHTVQEPCEARRKCCPRPSLWWLFPSHWGKALGSHSLIWESPRGARQGAETSPPPPPPPSIHLSLSPPALLVLAAPPMRAPPPAGLPAQATHETVPCPCGSQSLQLPWGLGTATSATTERDYSVRFPSHLVTCAWLGLLPRKGLSCKKLRSILPRKLSMALGQEHILLSLSFLLCPRTLKPTTPRSRLALHLLFSPGGSMSPAQTHPACHNPKTRTLCPLLRNHGATLWLWKVIPMIPWSQEKKQATNPTHPPCLPLAKL